MTSKALLTLLFLSLAVAGADTNAQVLTHGGVAPLTKIPSEQWIEKIVGDMAALEPMEQGALGFVPKKMAHFGYAKVETTLQVHGIGPFVNLPIDPVFELTSKGILAKPSLLKPGVPTSSAPTDCFKLAIGARMHGERGEGIVVGALCSQANQFTQYWIRKSSGERFWATLKDLKPLP